MSILKTFLQILFPESCQHCGKVGTLLCNTCIQIIPTYETNPEKPLASYIHPTFDYRNTYVKKLIWKLKYGESRTVSDIFSERMYETLLNLCEEIFQTKGVTKIYLVAVPITKTRKRERGYNQSELLIQSLLKYINDDQVYAPLFGTLERKQTSISQTKTHNKKERIRNIKNSMYISDRDKIIGKDIILVDDVVTTGATIKEARKVLLQAGARSVHAITIAH